MPDVFDEIEASPKGDVFDEITQEKQPSPWNPLSWKFNTEQAKEDWGPEKTRELREALSTSPLQFLPRIPRRENAGTMEKIGAGIVDTAQGAAEFLTSPAGASVAAATAAFPPIAPYVGAAFVPVMTQEAAKTLGEASVTKDPRDITRGALEAGMAALPMAHEAVKRYGAEKVKPAEAINNEIPKVAVEPQLADIKARGDTRPPVMEETKPGVFDQVAPESAGLETENLSQAFSEQAKGVVDSLYDGMLERMKAGKLPEPFPQANQSKFAAEAKAAFDAGNIKTSEDLKALANPMSVGPGAASPGDVPAEPPLAEVSGGGAETPAEPASHHVFKGLLGHASEFGTRLKGVAGESMPRTTAAAREVGETGVRYASSRIAARPLASVFSNKVLEGTEIDPFKFGTALAEDNLRSISQAAKGRETAAIAAGDTAGEMKAKAEAERVKSLVGSEKSPFKTEDEYQDFLAEPEVKAAIQRHIEQWDAEVEPMYREAMKIDPDVELPSRGQQTGARINLKAKLPDEETEIHKPVGRGASLTATFRRKSPFGARAKGTGQIYEGDYHSIVANTFERQLEIANKNAFDKALVDAGLAVIDKPGQRPEIGGKSSVAFPISRTVIIAPKAGETAVIPKGENIYVRSDLAAEYRGAANADAPHKIPLLTTVMNALNKSALAGLTDFTVHLSNQATVLFNRPLSGGLLKDSLLSATGRADIPVTLVKYVGKAFEKNSEQIAELAKIGALREQRPGYKFSKNPIKAALGTPGKLLEKSDKIVRSMLDDTYQQMVKDGLVEDTETGRREYVNQLGQYNKRLQGPWKRRLRDTGAGPFVTAGTAFNTLGWKMATMSPGAKAASVPAAVALRSNVLSKWVGAAALIGAINYVLTKDKGGGVMGRPGVPIGKIDTGQSDENGRPYLIPAADILGVGRALRVTGAGGAINAKRFGLDNSYAVDSAVRDIVNSAVGPAAGPPVRFGLTVAAGKAPAIGVKDTARPKAPGESQAWINIEAALKEANPIAATYFDWKEGKPMAEVVANQIPRFTVSPGRPEAMMKDYPRIVDRAVAAPFISYVIGEARRMPPEKRLEYLEKMVEKLENDEDKAHAVQEFRRRKVLP